MRSLFKVVLLTSAILLAGCSGLEQKPYQRPALDEKNTWSVEVKPDPHAAIQLEWWQNFGDATLDMLVNTAIHENLDIRIAAARIKEAEAALRGSKGRRLPQIGFQAEGDRAEFFGQNPGSRNEYSGLGTLNWELDVWGKLQKGVDASIATQTSIEANWRAVWLKVTATVARTYFDLRRLDEQIALRQSSIHSSENSLNVFRARMEAGFGTRTEVDSQDAELNNLQRQLLELQRQRQLAENRLAVLIGKPAGKLKLTPGQLRNIVRPVNIPLGLPSQLVARRPDIVAAERRVLRAHHLVGQAELAKLPSFTLTGNGGYASTALSRILDNWTLGLASMVRIPIFDPGVKTNIEINKARAEGEKERYRKTVMLAFEEVENSLTSLENRKHQHALLEQQKSKLETVTEHRRGQLAEGLISQLELFEAERSLLSASQTLLNNYQSILSETVTLYESLGGGWGDMTIAGAF